VSQLKGHRRQSQRLKFQSADVQITRPPQTILFCELQCVQHRTPNGVNVRVRTAQPWFRLLLRHADLSVMGFCSH
jgi:hypothetical protein